LNDYYGIESANLNLKNNRLQKLRPDKSPRGVPPLSRFYLLRLDLPGKCMVLATPVSAYVLNSYLDLAP
jgi:hypothetical protein